MTLYEIVCPDGVVRHGPRKREAAEAWCVAALADPLGIHMWQCCTRGCMAALRGEPHTVRERRDDERREP